MKDALVIRGARTHNLKNIDVTIPRNKLTVITGMSGSGKSSLAFDTIYAEGQRRYVESLSAYARQFLDQMGKPDVDVIEGLSPAVSVEQKSTGHNPRSTVGTITEIYDYLRLLFARVGKPFCHQCGKPIERQTVAEILERLFLFYKGKRIYVLGPLVSQKKGEYKKEFERLRAMGYARVRVNGEILDLAEEIKLDKNKKHTIEVMVDRFKVDEDHRARLRESLETALQVGEGLARIDILADDRSVEKTEEVSTINACRSCGISYPKLEPQMFSFNSPKGACSQCDGLGELMYVDESLVVPNENLSINEGAIVPWFGKKTNYYQVLLEAAAQHFGFSLDVPFESLTKKTKSILFEGSADFISIKSGRSRYEGFFEGLKNNLMRRYRETDSDWMREDITRYMSYQSCPSCDGERLRIESRHVKVNNQSIGALCALPLRDLKEFFATLKLSSIQQDIAKPILKELSERLGFLLNVGLGYLSLNRKSQTLSGGEAQRIRLATQIGAALVGVTYVLDEPSIGLHQRDNDRLIAALKNLRDMGNTVLVVEHDEDTILAADYLVDLGPRAGVHGGQVVYAGEATQLMSSKKSLTAAYLRGDLEISIPQKRRPSKTSLKIYSVTLNNIKNLNAEFPLGSFVCVTGVSGSGKSSLVNDTLLPALMKEIFGSKTKSGSYKKISGLQDIDKVIAIDQSPIGRTPRSNPATYTGLFTPIRDLFSALPESKARGYKAGRFSFNVVGGRCEKCEGDGVLRIEMHFLPDVFVQCESCNGKRFNDETLSIYFKGKNIADVLDMTVDEAIELFVSIPSIKRKLETLQRVGLGYIHLGQAATTLSGGEAQRIKLSRELSKRSTGKTVYILDEPTTGLHFEDVRQLVLVLNELVDQGNTVIVIEHNMDVIKQADHIIDMGPEGGSEGGEVVASGTPEEVARIKNSFTGKYLKPYLEKAAKQKKVS